MSEPQPCRGNSGQAHFTAGKPRPGAGSRRPKVIQQVCGSVGHVSSVPSESQAGPPRDPGLVGPWAQLACCLSKSPCWAHGHQDSAGQSLAIPTSPWHPPLWDNMPSCGGDRDRDRPSTPWATSPPGGRWPLPLPSGRPKPPSVCQPPGSVLSPVALPSPAVTVPCPPPSWPLPLWSPLPVAASPSVPSLLLKAQPRTSSGNQTGCRVWGAGSTGLLRPILQTGGRGEASAHGVVRGSFRAASSHPEVCGLDCIRSGTRTAPAALTSCVVPSLSS